jgi:DNA polymerase
MKPNLYNELVAARKACRRCLDLRNPSEFEEGRYDSDHVGPWSRWQGNLDASLMVVGQDWGDTRYFALNNGLEKPGNPTNRILAELLRSAGVDIGPPGHSHGADVAFFTNAVLCLKEGGLQAKVRREWFQNCRPFLRRQIEIVRPRAAVGLGQLAFESILAAYDIKPPAFRAAVEDDQGTVLPMGSRLFAVYHCGARILNTHRPLSAQLRDWQRIGRALGD